MAIDTSDFKNGMAMYLNNEVFTIIEFQHVKPGKGGAFVRTKLKKVKDGSVLDKTFRAGEKVESAYLEKKAMQYLYRQGEELTVMDMESYEQHPVKTEELGNGINYLKEEMEILAMVADDQIIGYEIPNFVELEVTETDPGFKGDTVNGTKPAKLETGATVQVPFHINQGDLIKVDTKENSYVERVKK